MSNKNDSIIIKNKAYSFKNNIDYINIYNKIKNDKFLIKYNYYNIINETKSIYNDSCI